MSAKRRAVPGAEFGTAFLLGILLFCLCQFGMGRITGFVIYPDEFGYWANAAWMCGCDWSEAVSLGSYYSFGYSLLLCPVFALFRAPITAYRAGIVLNFLLLCAVLAMLSGLLSGLFPGRERGRMTLAAGVAVFYPPWIVYLQLTLAEVLLMCIYVAVCLVWFSLTEKPAAGKGALLAFLFACLYFVHMRSVGILIAGGAVLLLAAWRERRYRTAAAAAIVFFCLFFCAGEIFKAEAVAPLYGRMAGDRLGINGYGGQIDKLRTVVEPGGIARLAEGCLGKLFYLGLSSFGLFYWGVVSLVKRLRRAAGRDYFSLFVLSSLMLHFAVSAVFTIKAERVDVLVYGRYNETLLPILMAFGVTELSASRRPAAGTALIAGIQALMIPPLLSRIGRDGIGQIQGYFIPGISYVLHEDGFEPGLFFWQAWLLGVGLTAVVLIIVRIGMNREKLGFLLFLLIFLETGLGMQVSEHYIFSHNAFNYGDIRVAEKIEEVRAGESRGQGREICYIDDGGLPFVDLIQFQLRGESIRVLGGGRGGRTAEENASGPGPDDFVLVIQGSEAEKGMGERYDCCFQDGHFSLYYNERRDE